jgi:uncharacterized protein (TIGR00251 family)
MAEQNFYTFKGERLIVKVKVIPGASKNEITGIKNGELVIKVKAPPEKGKANKELIAYLSKTFKSPKSDIELVSGDTSHHKLLSVAASWLDALKALAL